MSKKASAAAQLPFDYFVVKCQSAKGAIGLGILGTLSFGKKNAVLLLISSLPEKTIPGFDEFGMKMIAAVPETIRNDVRELTQRNVTPSEILKEIASRYRGTVFADHQSRTDFSLQLSGTKEPEKIMSQIMEEGMRLALKEMNIHGTSGSRRRRGPISNDPAKRAIDALKRMRNSLAPMESQVVFC